MYQGKNKPNRIFNGLLLVFAMAGVIFSLAASSRAETPSYINYQSRLKTKTGEAVTSAVAVRFSIYTSLTEGASNGELGPDGPLLWTEAYDGSSENCPKIQPDEEGYFSVRLGSCVAFPKYLDFTEPLYLGVTIDRDMEAVPRVLLASFPYAFNARTVDGLRATSTPAAGQLLALDSNLNFNINTGSFGGAAMNLSSTTAVSSILGRLGVGTSTPGALLTIQGSGNKNALSIVNNAGGQVLTVNEEGRVGIGTSTSDALLAVAGNIQVTGATILNGVVYSWPSGQGGPGTFLTNDGSGNLSWSALDSSGSLLPASGDAGSVIYYTGSGYSLSSSGNKNQILVSQGNGVKPLFLDLRSLLSDGGNIIISGTSTPVIAVSDTPSFSAVNGLSLTSLSDGFKVSGGIAGRTLTVTGGNLTVNGNGYMLQLLSNVTLGQDLATSSSPTFGSLSLGSPLAVAFGGTGARSFASGGLLYGAGEGSVLTTAAPQAAQILVGIASSTPGFVTMSGDATMDKDGVLTLSPSGVFAGSYGSSSETLVITVDNKGRVTGVTSTQVSGVAPGGAAGGDLSGSFPNPSVAKIGGWGLGDVTPTNGNLLVGSGPIWVSRTIFGDATIDANGRLDLATSTVSAGTYGNATSVPYFTVDTKGRLTSAGQNAISISPGQITQTIPVTKGGTGASSLLGILKGNGTSSVSSLTGTANTIARWTDQYTLGSGILYDTGSSIGVGVVSPSGFKLEVAGSIGPSASGSYDLGSAAVKWANVYTINLSATTITTATITPSSIQTSGKGFLWNDSVGRLGLGTSSPSERLSVAGNISFTGALMIAGNAGVAGNVLVSQGPGNSPAWQDLNQALSASMILNGGNSFSTTTVIGTLDNYDLALQTNGVERMRMNTNGNIGVGTGNPSIFKLQIAGNVGPDTDNAYNLGSAVSRWANVYANQIIASTVSGSINPSGFTQGPLVFGGVSGQLAQSSSLYWNDGTKRLGIGTSSPSQTLSVSGNVGFTGSLMPDGDAGTSGYALFSQGAGQHPVWRDINAVLNSNTLLNGGNSFSTTTVVGTLDNYDMVFVSNGNERMRITASGNVGVGTKDPSVFKLQVAGDVGPQADDSYSLGSVSNRWTNVFSKNIVANSVSGAFTPTNFIQGPLVFGGAGGMLSQSSGLYWDASAGKFGVGTTTPSQKLSIAGNLNLSGAFMPDNDAGTDGYVLTSKGTGLPPVWRNLNEVLDSSMILEGGNNFSTTTVIGTLDNYDLSFIVNDIERLRVTSGGFVGIGTSTPVVPLHVYAEGWNAYFGASSKQVRISDTAIGAFTNNSASLLTLGGPVAVSGPLKVSSLSSGFVRSDGSGNLSSSAVDLASSDVSGILSVSRGGTGLSAYTKNGLLYASDNGILGVTAAGTAGKFLVADENGVPRFVTLSGDASLDQSGTLTFADTSVTPGTYGSVTNIPIFTVDSKGRITSASSTLLAGVPPGGVASGDLTGSYPAPTVQRINGALLGVTSPTTGNILIGSGTAWETKFISGDATLSANGVLTLANTTVASGTYGSLTQVPILTVDAKGRITNVANTSIQLSASSVTSGILPIEHGGTGASSLLGILKGNGTSSVSSLTGTANTIARWTDQYTLGSGVIYDNGNKVSIGSSTATSLFNVGIGNSFQIDGNGDMVKINNISYKWPTVQGLNHTYLRNDGLGNLSWVSATSEGSPVNSGVAGRFAYYAADGASVSDQSILTLSGSSIGINTTSPVSTLGITGTLTVTGTSTLSALSVKELNVTSGSSFANLSVSGTASFGGITAESLAVTSTTTLNSISYIWPTLQGSAGQVLTNNGNGTLSWSTVSAGDSGTSLWTASNGIVYPNNTTDNVSIGATTSLAKLTVAGNALVTNDTMPTLVGSIATNISGPVSVTVSGKYAYVANSNNSTLSIYDVSNPAAIVAKGTISLGSGNSPFEIVVAGKYAYVVGNLNLAIFDISNPNSIVAKGTNADGYGRGLYVSGKYAYTISGTGLSIFDISNPNNIVKKSVINTNIVGSEDVYVQGKYAYVAGYGNSTLAIYDISNPDNIVALGYTTTNLNSPSSVYVSGAYAYVASSVNNYLAIFDISNPNNIVAKGYTSTNLNFPKYVTVAGRYAYVSSSGGNSIAIFDISNPNSIVSKGKFSTVGPGKIAVDGKYLYVTDTQNNTLKVYEINNLDAPGLQTGTLQSSTAEFTDNVWIGNSLYARGGANFGPGGLLVEGNVTIQGGGGAALAVGGPTISGAVASFTNSSGTCSINPTSSSLSCSSDARLKKDVTTIDSALEKVMALQGVTYHWLNEDTASATHFGFIAQDLEKIIPEVVSTDESGYKSVAYSALIPLLTQAIKEQQLQMENFRSGVLVQSPVAGYFSVDSLTVTGPVVFKGTLAVRGHLHLSSDSVGQAKILPGKRSVRVTFTAAYEYQPIVTVTPRGEAALGADFKYAVVDENSEGFTIRIDRVMDMALEFNWHAFASPEAKLTVSDGSSEDIMLIVSQPESAVAGSDNSESAAPAQKQEMEQPQDVSEQDVNGPEEPVVQPETAADEQAPVGDNGNSAVSEEQQPMTEETGTTAEQALDQGSSQVLGETSEAVQAPAGTGEASESGTDTADPVTVTVKEVVGQTVQQ